MFHTTDIKCVVSPLGFTVVLANMTKNLTVEILIVCMEKDSNNAYVLINDRISASYNLNDMAD